MAFAIFFNVKPLRNLSAHGYIFFGSLFYILPILFYYITQTSFTPIGIPNINLTPEIYTIYTRIVFIFFITFYVFSYILSKISFQYFSKISTVNFGTAVKFLFLFFIFITSIEYVRKIYIIQNIGYQYYHGGVGYVKRGFISFIIEIAAILFLQIGVIKKEYIFIIVYVIINSLFLMTGMRMPFFVNMYVLVLYLKPNILTKIYYIIPLLILAVLILIGVQQYRYGFNFFDSLTESSFYLTALIQINEIFGYTSELLLAIIQVKTENIQIGAASAMYDINHIFNLFLSKIFNYNLVIQDTAEYGNIGYNTYRYFIPDAFYLENATFGGSNLGDIFFLYGDIGIIIYSFTMAIVIKFFEFCRKNDNLFLTLLFFIIFPNILRSFRDGYIGWLINSSIIVFIATVLIISFRKTKNS